MVKLPSYIPLDHPVVSKGLEFLKVGSGVFVGEVTGMVTAAGVYWADDKVFKNQREQLIQFVSDRVIKPHLPLVEQVTDYALDNDAKMLEIRAKQTPTERAHHMAETAVTNLTASMLSLYPAVRMQREFDNRVLGSTRTFNDHLQSRAIDAAVHVGALVFMHTIARHQTKWVAEKLESVMTKVGVSQHTAHEMSTFLVRFQLPGWVGNVFRVRALMAAPDKDRSV